MKASKRKYILGIDLGGTKLLATLLDRRFRVLAERKLKIEIHRGEKRFFKGVVDCIQGLLNENSVRLSSVLCLGMGCPGMIKNPRGIVKLSPNLAFMKDYPLRSKLQRQFKIPVVIENDVNAGLYGEHQFGAAKGYREVVGIFPGTGVGGALILGGKLYRGATGAAGEIGHMFLSVPSLLHGSEKGETVESLIGRIRIASEAGYLMLKQKSPHLMDRVDFNVKKVKSGTLARAIRSGDREIRNLMIDKAQLLGIAMANIVNLLNPEMIILGGGLMEAMGHLILPVARKTMHQYAMEPIVRSVKVVPARLGDYAVVMGASHLALESLESESKPGRKR